MGQTLSVSYSSVLRFRGCEQEYYYGNVLRLRRKDKGHRLALGVLLHTYLERYYKAIYHAQQGLQPADYQHIDAHYAHRIAWSETVAEHRDTIDGYLQAALMAGADDTAAIYHGMLDMGGRVAERYFWTRGEQDAAAHRILVCEQHVSISLTPSIQSNGYIDMITTGPDGTLLWEHKSHESIPRQERRLRDLQTLLYARVAEQALGIKTDGVLWNYLRTKEPTVPDLLKSGQLTKRKDLDSTWGTYLAAIQQNGLREEDYSDVKERLADAEIESFFPRHSLAIVQQDAILIHDYIRTAKRIEERRWEWETGRDTPIRNVGYKCDFCEFAPLCQAAIITGDDQDVIDLRYTNSSSERAQPSAKPNLVASGSGTSDDTAIDDDFTSVPFYLLSEA